MSVLAGSGTSARAARALLIWALILAAVILVDTLSGYLFGARLGLASKEGEGRILLLLIASGAAIQLMSHDLRPLAAFGLSVARGWQGRLVAAYLVTVLLCGGVVWTGIALGALTIDPDFTLDDIWDPALTALVAGALLAYLQEIVYRGFVATHCADLVGRYGVVLSGFAFGLTPHFDPSLWRDLGSALPLFIGLMLAGIVLDLLKRVSGSLILPIGVVAGWVAVGVFVKRSHVVEGMGEEPWYWIVAPVEVPVLHYVVLGFLAVAILILWQLLLRPRDNDAETGSRSETKGINSLSWLTAPFAVLSRYNPVSSLMAFAQIDTLITAWSMARFRVGPAYLPRFVVMLALSLTTTLLCLPERLLGPVFRRLRPAKDPVIILGVHRSGTTHLHTLLALDPRLVAPPFADVLNPHGVVLVGRVLKWLLGPFLPWKRPFDSVEVTLAMPAEDEFALCAATTASPYWGIVFPNARDRFDRLIYGAQFTDREKRRWQAELQTFLAKLTLFDGRRPVLKSPYHTAKVALLSQAFPKARFIHLKRDPRVVHRSNEKLEREGFSLFQVQTPAPGNGHAERFLDRHYVAMEEAYRTEIAALQPSQSSEIRYEDLVRDPIAEIERVYREIGLEMTDDVRERLRTYLADRASYRADRYTPLEDVESKRVEAKLAPLIDAWGYR
ncbi:MAG: sulfotransferase [Pseudomonadota bacterium]